MPESNEAIAAKILEDRIKANGHEPESVSAVQKAANAYLCTARFAGDPNDYHAVVTLEEVLDTIG